jgi:hypothetical protein
MKMRKETYDTILEESRVIVAKLIETGAALSQNRPFDPANISMVDMWDMRLIADIDRSNETHPRHDYPGLLPRCLEFTDRDLYWLSSRDGEDLDDIHVETALKRIRATLQDEFALAAEATPSTPGM